MTSLAKQLQRLAVPHTQTIFSEDKRKKSFLFDPKEAAELDKETFYSLGINGLEELQNLDVDFQEYESSLFAESSLTFERSVQSKEINENLDRNIKDFLIQLSPYCLLKPAHKALEWLIYRYHIHQYNVDDLMICMLPYHESKVFTRAVQLLTLDSKTATKWDWLLPLQKSGVHLPRQTLINHCRTNEGFLSYVCEAVPATIKVHSLNNIQTPKLRTLFAFYMSTVIGVLETGEVTEKIISALLPHLGNGLKSKNNDYKASTYMIMSELFFRVKLKKDLLKTLLNALCKRMNAELLTEAISCLLLLFQTQDVNKLTKRSFKHICQQSGFVACLCSLVSDFKGDSFLQALLEFLVPAAFKQSLEGASSGHSSASDSDRVIVNHLGMLHEILSCVEIPERIANDIVRDILLNYLQFGTKTTDLEELNQMSDEMRGIVRLLEARYSESVDIAVKSVLKDPQFENMKTLVQDFLNLSVLSVHHQSMSDSDTSLMLSLNHRTSEVRINAVKYMLQHLKQISDKDFVSTSLMARLQDDSLDVVETVIHHTDLDIWTMVNDKTALMKTLTRLLRSGKTSQHKDISQKALHLLCACDPSLDEEVLPAVLPYLLLKHNKNMNVMQTFLTSDFSKRNKIFQPLVKKYGSKSSTKSPSKKSTKNKKKDPADLNIDMIETIAEGIMAMKETESAHLVTNLLKYYTSSSSVDGKYFLLLLLNKLNATASTEDERLRFIVEHYRALMAVCPSPGEFMKSSHVVDKSLWTYEKCVEEMRKEEGNDMGRVHMMGISLLAEFISHLDQPKSIKEGDLFWDYHNDSGNEDRYLYTLVQVFDLITLMSSDGGQYVQLYRNLTNQFIKKLSDHGHILQFLGFLWTQHINPNGKELNMNVVLQAKALRLGLMYIQTGLSKKMNSTQTISIFTNLLIALTSTHPGIRQCSIDIMEVLQPTAVEIDSPFLVLVNKVLRCQAELTADEEYVTLLMKSLLKKLDSDDVPTPVKRRSRKSSKQNRKQQLLDIIVEVVSQEDTPTYVKSALLNALKLVKAQTLFVSLQTVLDSFLSRFTENSCTAVEFNVCCSVLNHYEEGTGTMLTPGGPALASFIKALQCHTACKERKKTIQQMAAKQITQDFFNELDPDSQLTIIRCLFDIWLNADGPELPTQIKKIFKRLNLKASHIVSELENTLQVTSASTVKEAKRRKRKSTVEVSGDNAEGEVFESKSWQRITIILEAIQDKKKIQDYLLILPSAFSILSRILDSDNHASSEYIKQLVLSVVHQICDKAIRTDDATKLIPEQTFNMALIVNCIRTTDNPQTHHHALLVLTIAAKIYPEKLLHNIMSVFTFMGTNMLRHDDAYSFHIINRILETVIPALITACEQRTKVPKGISNNAEDVITLVIRVFVDAYPHIPQHRRLMLFTKLVNIVGQKSYLWRCLLLLIEHVVVKIGGTGEDETEKKEVLENHFEFLLLLCGQFTCEDQLSAAADIIQYITRLPEEKDAAQDFKAKTLPVSLERVKKEDADIFNLKNHTAKQLRHFKYEAVQFLVALSTSSQFIAQLSGNLDDRIVSSFQCLLEGIMEYIPRLTQSSENPAHQLTSRFWKALLHKVYELLDKIVVLLPAELFIEVVSNLMEHDLLNVQRKSIELLNSNLLQLKERPQTSQPVHMLPLVDRLIAVVRKSSLSEEATEENIVNAQTALYSLKLLCRLLGSNNPHTFIKVMKLSVTIFTTRRDNPSLSASALLCIAEICNSLKAFVISHLSSFMPRLIQVLKDHQTLFVNELYLLSVITTILKVVENLSLFLSPYLNDIVCQLCVLSSSDSEMLLKPQLQQRLKAIRHTLSTTLPPRIMLPVVTWCYDNITGPQIVCLKPLMWVLEEHVSSMKKEDLNSHIQQLQAFFLRCMDLRTQYRKQISLPQITDVEESIVHTFITMVMKLSEATFRPILFKLFDWATRDEATKHRVLLFYRLANSLSEKLRSLFTIFAGHIIQHAAQTLDQNNVSKADKTPFGKARKLTNELLCYILDCLYHCFLYDTEGFVTKERFDSLMQPLVDQLENLDKLKFYQDRIAKHLVPCVVQFAVAAQDDSLWKALNYQILLKTRSNSSEIKFAAVMAIDEFHKRFGEDYMPLLPETIPFLAELMEDENEEVEKKSHSVIADMEKTLGEPLQKYF